MRGCDRYHIGDRPFNACCLARPEDQETDIKFRSRKASDEFWAQNETIYQGQARNGAKAIA